MPRQNCDPPCVRLRQETIRTALDPQWPTVDIERGISPRSPSVDVNSASGLNFSEAQASFGEQFLSEHFPTSATLDRQNLDRPHTCMQADSQARTPPRTASARALHSADLPCRVGRATPLQRSFLPSAPRTSARSSPAPLRYPALYPRLLNTYFLTCRTRAHRQLLPLRRFTLTELSRKRK